MARLSVDGAGDTGRKRKKMSGAAEESPSKTRDLTKGNYSQNQDGMVESQERVVAEVENEAGEENIEEGGGFGTSNGSQTVVSIDTNVLDCSICCEPFRPPIYQCQNGHAVCSPCGISHSGQCPVCSPPINLIRSLALERVVKSVQISCINATYGCNTTLSYLQRDTHHKICNYRPCSCPISACAFKGSSISLSDHFQSHHRNSAMKFSYGRFFCISLLRTYDPFHVLLGSDGRLFLLLNNYDKTRGNALSLICISSCNEESNFEYELSVGEKTNSVKLKSSVERTIEWTGVYPTDMFLFIPKGFCSPNMIVHLCGLLVGMACSPCAGRACALSCPLMPASKFGQHSGSSDMHTPLLEDAVGFEDFGAVNDHAFIMETLCSMFPDISVESLAEMFHVTNGDLSETIDVLEQW